MKNILKSAVALITVMIITGSNVKAQKIGYVDLQELMQLMPEYKKASTDLEAFGKTLRDELDKMSEEFQKKVADFQRLEPTMSAPIKEVKQKELQDMQSRIQDFQQSAQENVRKKEAELVKPIIEKAKNAISMVAKEGGFAYIFDSSVAGFLYKPAGDDVLAAVKKKLGLI